VSASYASLFAPSTTIVRRPKGIDKSRIRETTIQQLHREELQAANTALTKARGKLLASRAPLLKGDAERFEAY
jgi:hypothetical protein